MQLHYKMQQNGKLMLMIKYFYEMVTIYLLYYLLINGILLKKTQKKRQLSDTQLDEFCYENNCIGWFSTSAKSGQHVKKGMNFMIEKIIENKKKLGSLDTSDQRGNNENIIDVAAIIKKKPQKKRAC
eukprot:181224_1